MTVCMLLIELFPLSVVYGRFDRILLDFIIYHRLCYLLFLMFCYSFHGIDMAIFGSQNEIYETSCIVSLFLTIIRIQSKN